jgi:hypothetical protein
VAALSSLPAAAGASQDAAELARQFTAVCVALLTVLARPGLPGGANGCALRLQRCSQRLARGAAPPPIRPTHGARAGHAPAIIDVGSALAPSAAPAPSFLASRACVSLSYGSASVQDVAKKQAKGGPKRPGQKRTTDAEDLAAALGSALEAKIDGLTAAVLTALGLKHEEDSAAATTTAAAHTTAASATAAEIDENIAVLAAALDSALEAKVEVLAAVLATLLAKKPERQCEEDSAVERTTAAPRLSAQPTAASALAAKTAEEIDGLAAALGSALEAKIDGLTAAVLTALGLKHEEDSAAEPSAAATTTAAAHTTAASATAAEIDENIDVLAAALGSALEAKVEALAAVLATLLAKKPERQDVVT